MSFRPQGEILTRHGRAQISRFTRNDITAGVVRKPLLVKVIEALVELLLAFVPIHQGIAVHPVTLRAGINAALPQGPEDLVNGRGTAFR